MGVTLAPGEFLFLNNLSPNNFSIHQWFLPELVFTLGLQNGDFLIESFLLHLLLAFFCKEDISFLYPSPPPFPHLFSSPTCHSVFANFYLSSRLSSSRLLSFFFLSAQIVPHVASESPFNLILCPFLQILLRNF